MLWFRKGIFFLSLCVLPLSVIAQSSIKISGTVTDTKTGETVPGVNAYLSGTTIGASTNKNGFYTIKNLPNGVYLLVFSFIGYQTRAFQLSINNGSSFPVFNVKLTPKTLEMGELEVVSTNKKWKENYEEFKKIFLGQTEFTKQTTIENSSYINFTNEKKPKKLTATTKKQLIVRNNALGYKLYIELVDFFINYKTEHNQYVIFSRYEELSPETEDQKNKWRKNRIKAYLGSFQHFLRSLYMNQLRENNFRGIKEDDISFLDAAALQQRLQNPTGPSRHGTSNLKGFKIGDHVNVSFKEKLHVGTGAKNLKIKVKKKGGFRKNKEDGVFFVYESGILLDPTSLLVSGDWAKNGVANSLPSNYKLDQHLSH